MGRLCGDVWEQQCVDNGYRAVDFAGGQPERENRAGKYKLCSCFKLYAELYSDESPENRLLSNKGSPSKGGELIVLVIEKICVYFDISRYTTYNVYRKSVAAHIRVTLLHYLREMVSWIVSVVWLVSLAAFARFLGLSVNPANATRKDKMENKSPILIMAHTSFLLDGFAEGKEKSSAVDRTAATLR